MKKKLLLGVLTVCMSLFAMAAFACGSSHECTFKSSWTHDTEYHWHKCEDSTCNKTSVKQSHSFVNGVCECGYEDPTYNPEPTPPTPPVHECTFESTWTHDTEYHWHKCEDSTCNKTSVKQSHSFVDGVCECGYEDPTYNPEPTPPVHECTFESAWTYNANNHWHKCEDSTCNKTSVKQSHSFVDGVCECGYEDPTYNPDPSGKLDIPDGITFSPKWVEYDTHKHSIQIVGNVPAGCTVSYTYNGLAVDGVSEVGTYTVVATISGSGYNTKTLSAKLYIRSTEELLYVVNHDGTIYFQNNLDDNKLYKTTGNGTISKVNNDQAEYFFSKGDNLYYYSKSLLLKTIKKINSEGKVSIVNNVKGEYIVSDGSYIYYAVNNILVNTDENGIYKLNLGDLTAEPQRLTTDKAAYLCLENGHIYYSNLSHNKYLYKISTNGGTSECLYEQKVEYIISDGIWLYFDATDIGSAIYRFNLLTEEATKLTTDSGKYLTEVDGYIYYVNNDLLTSNIFGDGIYKVSKLQSGSLPGIKVVSVSDGDGYSSLTSDGNNLYYYRLNDKHLYSYNISKKTEVDLMANYQPPKEEPVFAGDTRIAEYKGEIYYTAPYDHSDLASATGVDTVCNGSCLYKYNPDTKLHVKVLSADVAGVWFNGNYMYYSTCVLTNYALWRVDMNTGETFKVNSDRCENLIFEGDDIYYIKANFGFSNNIMKITESSITGNKTAEPEEIYNDKNLSLTGMTKIGDTFYFVNNPNVGYQKLYKYTIGEKKATELGDKAFEFVIANNKIYYYDDTKNALKCCDLDGSNQKSLVKDVEINDIFADGNKIYFSSHSKDNSGLYVYNTLNETNTRITDKVAEAICKIDGKIWFINTAVEYSVDYPNHKVDGVDGGLYCYDGTTVSKK